MPIEDRGDAYLVRHALASDTLSRLRSVETEQVEFRKGLVKLPSVHGRVPLSKRCRAARRG